MERELDESGKHLPARQVLPKENLGASGMDKLIAPYKVMAHSAACAFFKQTFVNENISFLPKFHTISFQQ